MRPAKVLAAYLFAAFGLCAAFGGCRKPEVPLTHATALRDAPAAPSAAFDSPRSGGASPPPEDASPADAEPSEAGLKPVEGTFEPLHVDGYPDAVLSLPTGATGTRPVLVVVHGSGDRPDWQCQGWRRAFASFPFIVCPTGFRDRRWQTRGDARYTHIGGAVLLAYIDASLAALASRYPDYVDARTPLLAGFSLGASEIVTLAVKDPARFPRIALVEGAWNAWSAARIAAYLRGGGQRVLYGAGQEGVLKSERAVAKRLVAAGLDARVVFAPVGHSFESPLVEAVRSEVAWLVEGDARYEGMSP